MAKRQQDMVGELAAVLSGDKRPCTSCFETAIHAAEDVPSGHGAPAHPIVARSTLLRKGASQRGTRKAVELVVEADDAAAAGP